MQTTVCDERNVKTSSCLLQPFLRSSESCACLLHSESTFSSTRHYPKIKETKSIVQEYFVYQRYFLFVCFTIMMPVIKCQFLTVEIL